MRRNTHHPSSGGTFLIHTPLPDTVHLRIEAKALRFTIKVELVYWPSNTFRHPSY